MVISVSTALEFDRRPFSNQLTLIEENNTSDGSFIVSSFLEQAVKKNQKIILLLFHNSIGHYYSISQKLGYSLSEYKDLGNMVVYDFLKLISDGISSCNMFSKNKDILKNLYFDIRKKVLELSKTNDVTLVIDNIGNLLLLGFDLKCVTFFIHYCRTLMNESKNFSVTCLTHDFTDNSDFRMLLNSLKHLSYLNIIVDDLKTGKAIDISGKFSIKWRTDDLTQWSEPNEYHYQLLDKNVNVFAPGTKYL